VWSSTTRPALLAAFLGQNLLGRRAARLRRRSALGAAVDTDQVVIVGIGCRFAGGIGSAGQLWDLCPPGWDCRRGVPRRPRSLWTTSSVRRPPRNPQARAGAFLYDAGDFDAQFFGISPREALAMDPQQRLLLETSWEALEDAGIDPGSLHGSSTGVFAGLIYHDYGAGAVLPEEVHGYLSTGGSGGVASGRVAYALGLKGPGDGGHGVLVSLVACISPPRR